LNFGLIDLSGQFLPFIIILLNCLNQLIFLFFEGLVFKQQSVIFVQERGLILPDKLKGFVDLKEL
jgi:hypothetical protein